MDSSSAAFMSGEQKKTGITVKKSTAALMMAAVFCAGALASWSMSGFGPGPSTAVTLSGSVPESTSAMELLTQYGKNATVLEPSMLYYCDYRVLAMNRGTYYEYGSSCGGYYHREQSDNA